MAMPHGSPRHSGVRPFMYDPTQLQAWYRANHINALDTGVAQRPAADIVPTHVEVSGNFGGIFNVDGIGTASSDTQANAISVMTNRSLTFTANSFKPLTSGQTSQSSVGSIMYSMALYQGTPTHIGGLISGPVSGADDGFNGQTLTVGITQVPKDGNLVLVLTRTLNITEKAQGSTRLVGTGNIGVTIN